MYYFLIILAILPFVNSTTTNVSTYANLTKHTLFDDTIIAMVNTKAQCCMIPCHNIIHNLVIPFLVFIAIVLLLSMFHDWTKKNEIVN